MTFYKWSQTAGTNATADATINWAEGQAPSSVNDSARGMMAATAKYRDDLSGSVVTGGSGVTYTVTSNQVFDTLAHMNGQTITFAPHATNTQTQAFLNVDGLGVKTIRSAAGVDIPAGTLIQGTPYTAIYNNADGVFYLHGFFGNPYNIPLASSMDYWGTSAPNSSFAFPYGQAISRTTYSTLFAIMGTTFGSGDGSTTFNLPDLRGRVTASPDNMGGSDIGRLTGSSITGSRTSLGGTGGEGTHALVASEIPSITSSGSISVTSTVSNVITGNGTTTLTSGGAGALFQGIANGTQGSGALTSTGTANVTSNNTGGNAHNVVQPTILCNRIMRII